MKKGFDLYKLLFAASTRSCLPYSMERQTKLEWKKQKEASKRLHCLVRETTR